MPLKPHMFSVFRIAGRGLEAQRRAIGATTENIANANTSRTADGTPYDIKRAVHKTAEDRYTRFSSVLDQAKENLNRSDPRHIKNSPLKRKLDHADIGPTTEIEKMQRERLEYDPEHPHADAEGYVHYPDINVVDEMSRMISANRVYEANLTALKSAKGMIKDTLKI